MILVGWLKLLKKTGAGKPNGYYVVNFIAYPGYLGAFL